MKRILILEDEKLVYEKIKTICDQLWYETDILFTNIKPNNFSLSNYDYILIDRDNELAEDWNDNFHDFFYSLWYEKWLFFKCIFISWNEINNRSIAYYLSKEEMWLQVKEEKTFNELKELYDQMNSEIDNRICTKTHPNWLEKLTKIISK